MAELAAAQVEQVVATGNKEASLLNRFLGLLIDGLISIPLGFAAGIPVLGLIVAPALVAYWMCRDIFMGPGRSIGKKVMGTHVVRLDGAPFTVKDSAIRNIIYGVYILFMIPVVGGIVAMVLLVPAGIVEIILVVTSKQRIGDKIGKTMVVAD